MAENRTYIPPDNLPVEEPIAALPQEESLPPAAQTPPEDPLVVVPSNVPPVHPPITLTLAEIEQEAKALGAKASGVEPAAPIEEPTVVVHTYENDMARAMNVSDAKTVQALLNNARDRESFEQLERHNKKARGWYTAGSIILLLVALAAIGYGAYHYNRLTVPVTDSVSIGVFSSTDSILSTSTTIEPLLQELITTNQEFSVNKPYLVELVADSTTQTLLSNTALFSFMGANPTEPFATSLSVVRLGIVDTGEKTLPFIIASTTTPDITLKEFLIAEPSMLEMFKRALTIDTTTIAPETTTKFVGEYRYNVPVRTLYTTDLSGNKILTMLYASVTDNIIVITTDPAVLKAVYDTVLRQ